MIYILINLLIISNILVFVIDVSGFVQEMETLIHKHFFPKYPREAISIPKPFSCSLCLTFWTGLIYLIFTKITIPLIGYVCLLSLLTPVFADIQLGTRDLLIRISSKIS